MDWISWLALLGICIFGLVLLYGIRRAKTYTADQQALALGLPGHGAGQPDASALQNHPYIVALQSEDPAQIAKAPLPDFLTPELLFQGITGIRSQTSLLDQFIDRIARQFTIQQQRKLTLSWIQYIESIGASQNTFLHQVTERLLVPLQQQKDESTLKADIADENRRRAEARQAQKDLGKPKDERPQKPKDEIDEWIEAMRWREDAKRRLKVSRGTEEELQMIDNAYEDRVRRIQERLSSK